MCYFLFLANSLRWRAVIHGGFNVYSCLVCPNQLIYEISSVLWSAVVPPPGAGQTDVIMHHCTRCGVCEQHACTRVHGERQSLHVLPL